MLQHIVTLLSEFVWAKNRHHWILFVALYQPLIIQISQLLINTQPLANCSHFSSDLLTSFQILSATCRAFFFQIKLMEGISRLMRGLHNHRLYIHTEKMFSVIPIWNCIGTLITSLQILVWFQFITSFFLILLSLPVESVTTRGLHTLSPSTGVKLNLAVGAAAPVPS